MAKSRIFCKFRLFGCFLRRSSVAEIPYFVDIVNREKSTIIINRFADRILWITWCPKLILVIVDCENALEAITLNSSHGQLPVFYDRNSSDKKTVNSIRDWNLKICKNIYILFNKSISDLRKKNLKTKHTKLKNKNLNIWKAGQS